MTSNELSAFFDERFSEIQAYLGLLQDIEDATRKGPPRIDGSSSPISASQQKILNSGLYLQLYNLVEATVSRCLNSVATAMCDGHRRPADLNAALRSEWVRSVARTHVILSPDHRLEAAMAMCDRLLGQLPIADFKLEVGGGGNWDDDAIEAVSRRVGCDLKISRKTKTAAKRHVRDNMGALKLVKDRRNGLAHGSLSFVDCSDGVAVAELRTLTNSVGDYLQEAMSSFVRFIATEVGVPSGSSSGAA